MGEALETHDDLVTLRTPEVGDDTLYVMTNFNRSGGIHETRDGLAR